MTRKKHKTKSSSHSNKRRGSEPYNDGVQRGSGSDSDDAGPMGPSFLGVDHLFSEEPKTPVSPISPREDYMESIIHLVKEQLRLERKLKHVEGQTETVCCGFG